MVNLQVFGVGAAGNKAAIEAMQQRIIAEEKVKLLNTTLKDIPDEYKRKSGMVHEVSTVLGGCAKEPSKGADAMYHAIMEANIDIGAMIDVDTQAVVLISSTEGGTGCGAVPILAKYFISMGMPVHVYALIGFQDDRVGVANTISFFKNIPDGIILHTIQNKKFLDYTNDYAKAEQLANEEFADQLEILIGSKMIDAKQNIDDMDLYKVVCNTPGYMDIRHVQIDGAKNFDLTNQAIMRSFEEMKGMEYDNGGTSNLIIAVIVNADKNTQQVIDDEYNVVKRYTGEPKIIYRHIQWDENSGDEYIDIIIAGLPYPEKAILQLPKVFNTLKDKANKQAKKLSDILGGIEIEDESDDMNVRKLNNPNDTMAAFAKMMGAPAAPVNNQKSGGKNGKVATRVATTVDSQY